MNCLMARNPWLAKPVGGVNTGERPLFKRPKTICRFEPGVIYDMKKRSVNKYAGLVRKPKPKERSDAFYLSPTDRVRWIYKISEKRTITEIVYVGYELQIDPEWHTVVRYDNCDGGKLHRHLVPLIGDKVVLADTIGIKRRYKNVDEQLTWSIRIIKQNYLEFRNGFIKRNKKYIKEHGITLI